MLSLIRMSLTLLMGRLLIKDWNFRVFMKERDPNMWRMLLDEKNC